MKKELSGLGSIFRFDRITTMGKECQNWKSVASIGKMICRLGTRLSELEKGCQLGK